MVKEFVKGTKVKLSTNFSSDEWDCSCKNDDCKKTLIEMDHVAALQELRTKWGKSVSIHSGFRCVKHNKAEGGATKSRHLVSDATDIVVAGMTPEEVAKDCEAVFNGIGRYDFFTHVDSRPTKARWNFRTKK